MAENDYYLSEINRRTADNNNNRDKALITLSSSLVAATVVFVKSPLESASGLYLLLSWVLFGVTIILVVISFDLSTSALMKEAERHRLCSSCEEIELCDSDKCVTRELSIEVEKAFSRLRHNSLFSMITFVLGMASLIGFGICRALLSINF